MGKKFDTCISKMFRGFLGRYFQYFTPILPKGRFLKFLIFWCAMASWPIISNHSICSLLFWHFTSKHRSLAKQVLLTGYGSFIRISPTGISFAQGMQKLSFLLLIIISLLQIIPVIANTFYLVWCNCRIFLIIVVRVSKRLYVKEKRW